MSQDVYPIQDVITQLSNLALAFAKLHAATNADATSAFIGYAIEASKQSGASADLLIEIHQKALPGRPLPRAVPDQEFQELLNRNNG